MKDKLKKLSLFRELPGDIIEKLAPISSEEPFDEGALIFDEGTSGDTLYIIESGSVAIKKLISKEENTFKTLAVMREGNFFGEMALFESKPRSASAFANTSCTLVKISGIEFQKLLKSDAQAASVLLSGFISVISNRLRQTSRELVTLYETGKIIGAVHDPETLSQKILHQILFAIPEADAGLVGIWNEFTEEFDVTASSGFTLPEETKSIDKNEALAHHVMQAKEPALIDDIESDARFKEIQERFYFGKSMILCPFINMENILGLMILANKAKNSAFTSDNVNLVSAVTSQAASAIQNARHAKDEELRQRLQRGRY